MLLRCSPGPIASLKSTLCRYPSSRNVLPLPLGLQKKRNYASLEPGVSHDIGIVGGGITGLATAYYLTKQLPRAKITIYEANDRVGGWLQSRRVPVPNGTVLFEAGPRTLRVASNNGGALLACSLIQELGLKKDTIFTSTTSPAHRSRYMYYPDHLVRMPHPSFGLFNNAALYFKEPIFANSAWSIISELFKSPRDPLVKDESIGDFITRRFSKTMAENLFSGFVHGVYAGDIWKLSAKSLLSLLWKAEIDGGSVILGVSQASQGDKTDKAAMIIPNTTQRGMELIKEVKGYQWDPALTNLLSRASVYTFREGLGTLSDALTRVLYESGKVTFKTSTSVNSIRPCDDGSSGVSVETSHEGEEAITTTEHSHVIPTLSAKHLSSFLNGPIALKKALSSIPHVTVMTVSLYFGSHASPSTATSPRRSAPVEGSPLHPVGFGYLIPSSTPFEENPERALGVVFDDAYSPSPKYFRPDRWPKEDLDKLAELNDTKGIDFYVNDFSWTNFPNKPVMQDEGDELSGSKVTVMLGGHWWDGWPSYPSEEEGLEMAKSILRRHLGITEEPLASNVSLQKDCIPQYTVGHEERLKVAHNELWKFYRGRVLVAGNWIAGVGVNDCIKSGWDVAKSMSTGREATGLEEVGNTDTFRMKMTRDGRIEKMEN